MKLGVHPCKESCEPDASPHSSAHPSFNISGREDSCILKYDPNPAPNEQRRQPLAEASLP